MEQHRIVGPARGEPRPAGEVGARVRVPLSGTPSARWAEALRSHLTGALAGHSHVGHVRLNSLVQGATVVIEGVEPEEAERLGPVLQHAVADGEPHRGSASRRRDRRAQHAAGARRRDRRARACGGLTYRSSRRRIFPDADFGISSTTSTARMRL